MYACERHTVVPESFPIFSQPSVNLLSHWTTPKPQTRLHFGKTIITMF